MSQTIRRKSPTARKTAAQQSNARKVRNAKAKTGSALDSVMAWLPFSEEQLHRIFLATIFGTAIALVWIVALMAGVPQLISQQFAAIAADTGFAVSKVEVRGVKHLNELKIYALVEGEVGKSMSQVDVAAIRAQLVNENNGINWIEDARVSRQLPDRLVIDVVERTPHAVLRKPDRLMLIDAQGHELDPVSPERAKGKLIVFGPGAGKQVAALSTLLEAAPALKPQVAEAEWVGNRRWNLKFNTGQVLALPEGEKPSANALMSFARLDGVNRLLGGKALAFDMRDPARIYFRVPGGAVTEGVKALAAPSQKANPEVALAGKTAAPKAEGNAPDKAKSKTQDKPKPKAKELD